VNLGGSVILLATALVAFVNWLLVRKRPEGTALLS
jgi:hypothetical protein